MPPRKKQPACKTRDEYPAKTINKLMEEDNIRQKDLSKALGVSSQTISLYINGQSKPSYDLLISIARYFNTSTDYLLGLTGSRSPDISTREICKRSNLTDGAFSALSSLSRSDTYRVFIANEIIEAICADPLFLDNAVRYYKANEEIIAAINPGPEEDPAKTGGALVLDPDGDDLSFLRFKASDSFSRLFDAVTLSALARSRADLFKEAHPKRTWEEDGKAGPIWYVPARSGPGCYPVQMTFEQYKAEISALLSEYSEEEQNLEQITDLFTRAAIQYEYNGDAEQFKADQKARAEARRKRFNYGLLPEENE